MKSLFISLLLLGPAFAHAQPCESLMSLLRHRSFDLSTVQNTYECSGNANQENNQQPAAVSICLATANKTGSADQRFIVWQNSEASAVTMNSRLGAFYSRSGEESGRPYFYELRVGEEEVLFQASWYDTLENLKIRTVSLDKSLNLFRSVSVQIDSANGQRQETDRVELNCERVKLDL